MQEYALRMQPYAILGDVMKKRRGPGRPPEREKAMTVTIPLRLPQEFIDEADRVIEQRSGQGSRNAVLREALAKGFAAMRAEVRK